MHSSKPHRLGWLLIGIFLIFGASMLALSALMLSLPDLSLAKLFWSLRPKPIPNWPPSANPSFSVLPF